MPQAAARAASSGEDKPLELEKEMARTLETLAKNGGGQGIEEVVRAFALKYQKTEETFDQAKDKAQVAFNRVMKGIMDRLNETHQISYVPPLENEDGTLSYKEDYIFAEEGAVVGHIIAKYKFPEYNEVSKDGEMEKKRLPTDIRQRLGNIYRSTDISGVKPEELTEKSKDPSPQKSGTDTYQKGGHAAGRVSVGPKKMAAPSICQSVLVYKDAISGKTIGYGKPKTIPCLKKLDLEIPNELKDPPNIKRELEKLHRDGTPPSLPDINTESKKFFG